MLPDNQTFARMRFFSNVWIEGGWRVVKRRVGNFPKIYQILLIHYLASYKATTFIICSRLGRIIE